MVQRMVRGACEVPFRARSSIEAAGEKRLPSSDGSVYPNERSGGSVYPRDEPSKLLQDRAQCLERRAGGGVAWPRRAGATAARR